MKREQQTLTKHGLSVEEPENNHSQENAAKQENDEAFFECPVETMQMYLRSLGMSKGKKWRRCISQELG